MAIQSTRYLAVTAALLVGLLIGLVDAFLPLGIRNSLHRASRAQSPTTAPPSSTSTTFLSAAAQVDPPLHLKARPDWLPKIPEGCDSDYECEGTESCCDFIFFKMCCSDGGHTQEAWTPVPIPVRPGDGYQQGGGYAGNGGFSGSGGLYR
ncbi:hypothetical protein VYU27_003256 [Nannochloropsis oceanica]